MGFDLNRFEGEVDQDLVCLYCGKVFEDPVTVKCGHTFCKLCFQKALSKKKTDCPKCDRDLTSGEAQQATSDLVEKLGKLTIHCEHQQLGCETVVPFEELSNHMGTECAFRLERCEHKGCDERVVHVGLEKHMEKCDYRIVECKVCKVCLPYKDMPAHQAVKRCYEQLNKRRMVKSARKISQELREHRVEMVQHRHLTEQAERRIEREHYSLDSFRHRRAMSAGPVLMRSVQARVGSAIVVPHYSRNLKSAALETCRDCTNKFTKGRRPSARRHSHMNVRKDVYI